MDLESFVRLYKPKNEIIIKRKMTKLDFTIRVGLLFRRDLRISVNDKKLCIGKTTIKIEDLKRINIYSGFSRFTYSKRSYWLEFVGRNIIMNQILLDDLSGNDLDKISKLFKHFIFANDIDDNRLTSEDYEFLITSKSSSSKHKLNEYSEEQKNAQTIKINSKEYSFIKVLPKKYYRRYLKKEYLLFETKYQNSNYMDVWRDKEKEE